MTPKMLSTADAARLLGLAPYTLRLWRHLGKGPRYFKPSSAKQANVFYLEEDVNAFRDARTFTSTSDVTVNFPAAA
jgi:hypothetical protein